MYLSARFTLGTIDGRMAGLEATFHSTDVGSAGARRVAGGVLALLEVKVVTEALLGGGVHADAAKGKQSLRHPCKIAWSGLRSRLAFAAALRTAAFLPS